MTALRVDGQVLDGQILHLDADWQTLYVKMAEPTSTADAFAILRRAHKFAMRLDSDEPLVSGTHVVETWIVPPGGQDFHNHRLVAGTWVAALRFNDAADWPMVAAQFDDNGDAQNIAHKGGGDTMDTRDKIFIDPGHAVNRETLLLLLGEALRPIRQDLADLNRRLDKLPNLTPRLPAQRSFSDLVRDDAAFAEVEEAAREKARATDPFGTAVRERRAPLTIGHKFLRRRPR